MLDCHVSVKKVHTDRISDESQVYLPMANRTG